MRTSASTSYFPWLYADADIRSLVLKGAIYVSNALYGIASHETVVYSLGCSYFTQGRTVLASTKYRQHDLLD